MTSLSPLAEALRIARRVGPKMPADLGYDDARAHVDLRTGGELDAWQLDLVTDEAIKARELAKKAPKRGKVER